MKRPENLPDGGFALLRGIKPGAAAAQSLPVDLGVFQGGAGRCCLLPGEG